MLRQMTSGQVLDWIAFYQLEPWGIGAIDGMIAHFKALFVNSNLKKGKHPYKPEKFLTFPEPKKGGEPAPDDLFENEWSLMLPDKD